MSTISAQCPTTVTIVVVLTWISAVLDVIAGASLVALAGDNDVLKSLDATSSTATTLGIGFIVLGVVTAFVAWRLGRGGKLARILVSIIAVINLVAGIYSAFALGTHNLAEGATDALIALVTLALLWNNKANQYFRHN